MSTIKLQETTSPTQTHRAQTQTQTQRAQTQRVDYEAPKFAPESDRVKTEASTQAQPQTQTQCSANQQGSEVRNAPGSDPG